MHHTVCLYVVDTATFQRLCATYQDPLIISRFTTQQHARVRNPTRCPTRTRPPVRGLALHTKTHPRRTTREASCRYVHPTRTILNAIDECATRRIDRRVRSNTRDASRVFERTDDVMVGPPSLETSFLLRNAISRRRSAHRAIGSREMDDRGSSDRSRSAYSSDRSRSASSAGGEEESWIVKKGSIGINPIIAA